VDEHRDAAAHADRELPLVTSCNPACNRVADERGEPTSSGSGSSSGSIGSIGSIGGIGSSPRLLYPEGEHAYQQFSP
jgi:hypothetical protein